MEQEKASPTMATESPRRIGWRIVLAGLAFLGMWVFAGGLGRANYFRIVMGWPSWLAWVWPYVTLAGGWSIVAALAMKGVLRPAFRLGLVVLICTIILFAYDIAHPRTRAQIYGADRASYYLFWPWWSQLGWAVEEADEDTAGPWSPMKPASTATQ